MTIWSAAQLAASTVLFIGAATVAKAWALAPGAWRLALVLVLYTAGNLVMLRLIRDFGLGIALSLSAVIQLIAINIVAVAWYGEKIGAVQGAGIVLAVVAVALITLGPYLTQR